MGRALWGSEIPQWQSIMGKWDSSVGRALWGSEIAQWQSIMGQWDSSVGRALWGSGIAQWVEHYGMSVFAIRHQARNSCRLIYTYPLQKLFVAGTLTDHSTCQRRQQLTLSHNNSQSVTLGTYPVIAPLVGQPPLWSHTGLTIKLPSSMLKQHAASFIRQQGTRYTRCAGAVSSCWGGSVGVVPKYTPKHCLTHDFRLMTCVSSSGWLPLYA